MRNTYRVILVLASILAVSGSGCGLRPSPQLPAGVTEADVICALREQSGQMVDFKGKAFARAQTGGNEETASLQLAYVSPDKFKTVIKGTFGIVYAVVTMNADSLNMYFPSENGFLHIDRVPGQDSIQLPGIDFNLQRFTSYFTGVLPPQDVLSASDVILLRTDDGGDLVINTGHYSYRYHVTGEKFRLTEYEIYEGQDMVWHMTCSGYREWEGGVFPRKMILVEPDRELALEFSGCVINGGLEDKDTAFHIPSSAERLIFKPSGSDLP